MGKGGGKYFLRESEKPNEDFSGRNILPSVGVERVLRGKL